MRYILGVLAVILVAFLLLFALSSHSSNSPQNKAKQALRLSDYANQNSSVSFTTEGPIVGEDQFSGIRITITSTTRTAQILQGYESNVQQTDELSNTPEAYNSFLKALSTGNFLTTKTASYADERSVCPFGNRYLYDLTNNGKTVNHTWSVSCGTALGTFGGNLETVSGLFENQISNYRTFTANVGL